MPADLNTRSNIFVLIDEAHRTTGGDLGNYLMAGVPTPSSSASPARRWTRRVRKGTFKTFGRRPDGYTHKYSIRESIEDGTTLPLYYNLAPNEMLASPELMEKEFWSVAETEGITDIEELNKILDRAVNLKNFLKGDERVDKIAGTWRALSEEREPLGTRRFWWAWTAGVRQIQKARSTSTAPEYSRSSTPATTTTRRNSRPTTSTRRRRSRSARTSPRRASSQDPDRD
jgi:type I restriction enzyme R subunit